MKIRVKTPRRQMMPRASLSAALAAIIVAAPLAPAPYNMVQAQQATANVEQSNAVLIADSLKVEGRNRLIATGSVEVFHQGKRLRAREIIYDRQEDRLKIKGPITLTDGDDIVILAGSAELDPTFENGLMLGARMVLDQRVQLAANQLSRVGGRYSELYKVAATSCRVCETGRPPLWQIRAQKTTHDKDAKQLYFDNAQLRVLDVPILWLPRLRLPDPTLDRATGFLIPSLRQSSRLGFGVRVPYFIRIGDHRDLTLTPYISNRTRTLEWRYRQAFKTGGISFQGALSRDTLRDGTRGYVFGTGQFDLPRDYTLDLNVEAVTDTAYLLDYDYSNKDRLRSEVGVHRVTRNEYVMGSLTSYQTLREDETNSQLPAIVADGFYEYRSTPQYLGGTLTMAAGFTSLLRYSDDDTVGRDVSRADASLNWQRNWTLPFGVRANYALGVVVDGFNVRQDSTTPSRHAEVTPHTQLTLRWPLMARSSGGTAHLLEPIAAIGWTGGSNQDQPNEDSTRSEFDEGNLLSLSRFAGSDRRERGGQAAVGLSWTRQSPNWASNLTLGQVYREDKEADFSATSGLSGATSDILVAGYLRNSSGLGLSLRTLLDSKVAVNKAEARALWMNSYSGLSASYVWLGQDPAESRNTTISEWTLDGHYRFAQHWTGATEWRYDVAADKLAEAKLGVNYRNECVNLNLSLSRRFTTSSNVEASTSVDFTVNLTGFSSGKTDKSYTRSCRT